MRDSEAGEGRSGPDRHEPARRLRHVRGVGGGLRGLLRRGQRCPAVTSSPPACTAPAGSTALPAGPVGGSASQARARRRPNPAGPHARRSTRPACRWRSSPDGSHTPPRRDCAPRPPAGCCWPSHWRATSCGPSEAHNTSREQPQATTVVRADYHLSRSKMLQPGYQQLDQLVIKPWRF